MSWTNDLLEGFAEYLAAEGVGIWRSSGVYASDETAIVIGDLPQTPPHAIALHEYGVADNSRHGMGITGIQIRFRGGTPNPRDVNDLSDAAFSCLEGLEKAMFGGVSVDLVYRQLHARLGRDSNNRYEIADSYYLLTNRPTDHRE